MRKRKTRLNETSSQKLRFRTFLQQTKCLHQYYSSTSEQSPVIDVQEVLGIFKIAAFVETVLPLSLLRRGGRGEVANMMFAKHHVCINRTPQLSNCRLY